MWNIDVLKLNQGCIQIQHLTCPKVVKSNLDFKSVITLSWFDFCQKWPEVSSVYDVVYSIYICLLYILQHLKKYMYIVSNIHFLCVHWKSDTNTVLNEYSWFTYNNNNKLNHTFIFGIGSKKRYQKSRKEKLMLKILKFHLLNSDVKYPGIYF